ncbi:thiamine biosynthesis protein ThiS [Caldalkalibacillus uzonensis]|uniref:Thiamine biosynthesis protein ThiS n=1 Tax=Caldalkalibacillus uzonensis TaxID=353224 RepID=A0ABU0CV85_9BACI|nr:sulfur carrier protein ThiS [Caldalkalibacillus uzonensis]MDQ0340342.1 thiamine biosynthesis protein ThiS [Caldalkalibacillus uzonensis]
MKTLIVNGKETNVACESLEELIEHYQLNKSHVVAEVDGHIVHRSEWGQYKLKPGAKVELVHFVGGG